MQNFNLKIKSKCIIGQNITGKAIKFLEDNIEENLGDLGFGDEFSDTLKVHYMKEKN